jgi:hypothetical protein
MAGVRRWLLFGNTSRSGEHAPRRVAGLSAVTILILGMVSVPAAAAAASSGADCTSAEAPDAIAAERKALECGVTVENLAERTEYAQVMIDATGTRTMTVASEPQRIKRADGRWAKIKPTLHVSGGVVVPEATLADVQFSAGGPGPLVSWRSAAGTFEVYWPYGPLPPPSLRDDTAVYESVLPQVNLHVTATTEGFTHAVEVLTPEAAALPEVRRLRYRIGGDARVEPADDDGLRVMDADGRTLAVSRSASMWDSSDDPASAGEVLPAASAARAASAAPEPATAAGPAETSQRRPVGVEMVGDELIVTADEQMLADPDVQWPLFIDPPFNGLRSKWAYANSANKDWDVENRAWVGVNPYDGVRYRSFFDFNVSTLRGTQVLSAKVTMKLDHSWSCDNTYVHLYRTNTDGITAASGGRMAWSTRPLPSSHWLDSWAGHANEAGGCGTTQPDADAVFEGATLTSDVQLRATGNATTYTVGLCACNSEGDYETAQDRWKKFFTGQTYLIATYDKAPNAPAPQALSTTTDCYKACSSPAVVRTTVPTLRANVSDPYNGNLRSVFEVRASASATATLVAGNSLTAPVTTGAPGTATWKVPVNKLVGGTTYYWRAQSTDENDLTGAWSGWQTLTVDTTAPSMPTVDSAQYPEREWGAVVGTAGTFTLAGETDMADFSWQVDSGSVTTVTVTGTGPKTATAPYTPPTDLVHTLQVTAKDIAGNISGSRAHQFWVSPLPEKYARWKLDETSGTTAADSGTGSSTLSPGTLNGPVSFGTGYIGNGATFSGPDARITASGPVLDTTRSFTVMAWARATNLNAGAQQTILSQDGALASRFQLQFRRDANGGTGGWCFSMRATDGGTPTSTCTDGSAWGLPTEGTWVHLAGVYDAVTGTIRVYVMGDPLSCGGESAATSFTGNWSATGSFVIGRALADGASAEHWRGDADDVYAFQRVLNAAEICQQAVK